VGGIGPLPTTPHQQALRAEAVKHPLQQPLRRIAVDQPRAELAQHRAVKSRVGQLQARRVLPADPATARVGGLPV